MLTNSKLEQKESFLIIGRQISFLRWNNSNIENRKIKEPFLFEFDDTNKLKLNCDDAKNLFFVSQTEREQNSTPQKLTILAQVENLTSRGKGFNPKKIPKNVCKLGMNLICSENFV